MSHMSRFIALQRRRRVSRGDLIRSGEQGGLPPWDHDDAERRARIIRGDPVIDTEPDSPIYRVHYAGPRASGVRSS
ncbi:MAG: hypothetical protein WCW14_02170 [Candidatus Paceibacterota bacterium]